MKTIKEVAEEFGMTARTVRYYEEIGLLKPERSETNHRLYGASEIAKLKLIVRGKQYGFNLDQIKEMVLLFDADRSGKKQLEKTIEYGEQQVADISRKIGEMQAMKAEMESLLDDFKDKLAILNEKEL